MSQATVIDNEVRRFTRSEYHAMADLGMFENENVELLEGEIVMMSPQTPRHSMNTARVGAVLSKVFGEGYLFLQHSPLCLPNQSEPEPDVAVVKGSAEDFLDEHPTTAELVVEISFSSYEKDSERKMAIYANGGIPEYWILNLLKTQLEVFWSPVPNKGRQSRYKNSRIFKLKDIVSPLGKPHAKIKVADLFPTKK